MRDQEIKTVTILAQLAEGAREALAKLAKRGARYGQTISWTETPGTEQRGSRRVLDAATGKWISQPIMVDVIALAITGEAPRVGDFTFEAALERAPGGVIVSAAPGTTKSVGKLGRQWDGRCDHCGSNRARTHGFIVAKGRTRKVVGRSCLRDHLGMDAPESLAARFAFLRELEQLGEDDSWGGFASSLNVVDDLISTARACIALWGWRPGSFDGQTTAEQVWLRDRTVSSKSPQLQEQQRELRAEIKANGDRYRDEAAQIIAWARALKPGRSDYLHNLQVACGADVVKAKHQNLVISAAAAWDKQVEREAERKRAAEIEKAKRPASDWIGTVGQRIECDAAELISTRVLPDNGFGESTIYKFALASGPVLVWITGGMGLPRDVKVGSKFNLRGTVKSHGEFADVKETKLARCKVVA